MRGARKTLLADFGNAIAGGEMPGVFESRDGGETWSKVKTNLDENLYSVSFSEERTGFAVGANGTTNPVLQVDASTGSVATGLKVTGGICIYTNGRLTVGFLL